MGGRVTGRSITYAATQVCQALLVSLTFHSSHFLPKLVLALSSAKGWKKKHVGFHFPTFYNFIVDIFKDPEDNIARTRIDELLQWWNGYVYIQYTESEVLIFSLLFSKVFPATDSAASVENSRRAMLDCQKRLWGGHLRQAELASAHDDAAAQ